MQIGKGVAFNMQYSVCKCLDFSPKALFIDIIYEIRNSITYYIVSECAK